MFANTANLFRIGIIAIVLCGLLTGPPAMSQTDDDPAGFISMENSYLGVAIGQYGKWKLPDPPYNHFMIGDEPAGGRFQLYTTGGDPTTTQDDNQLLNYGPWYPPKIAPGDKWGAFQVMVDAVATAQNGSTTGSQTAWATFPRGGSSAMLGDLKDGSWVVYPYKPTNRTNVITGCWYPNISKGATATAADVPVNSFPLQCVLEVRLLRDTARFKWTITNQDSIDHRVGIRCYADVMPNPNDDGTVDMRNIVSIPGHPLIEDRTLLQGKDIPPSFDMFNSQSDPVMSIRAILKSQGATPPDALGLDEWGAVANSGWTYWFGTPDAGGDPMSAWSYEPTPNQVIYDLGYGAFWKPRRVIPGGSVTYITYMGLGCSTSDFTKPNIDYPQYVASTQGPRTLKYASDAQGVGQLYPAPFTIHAWMQNTEKYTDFQTASFTLNLPDGLALDDSENGKYSKSLDTIRANTEGHVSWLVKPVGHPTGIMSYAVSVSASPVGGTTVQREINIPATEVQPFRSGWQMVSVPFTLTDTNPTTALGLSNAVYWRYDTYQQKYLAVTKLVPGEAYWLKLSSAQTTAMTAGNYAPMTWTGTQGYSIPLQTGWNLIGNPYLYAFTLGEAKFYYRDLGTITYDEAVAAGLINSTLFWWDPLFKQYKWASDRTVQIKPWQGYWLRATRPGVSLVVSPASQIGASVDGQPTAGDTGGGDNPPPAP